MKIVDTEHDQFSAALRNILKADPKAVQASMDADKAARAAKREAKKSASASGRVRGGRV
jgi:hypothetical protein